ncbi:hypothetical protein Lal_00023999 [Lupinus albus]|uniref:Rad60/SUMO-like domain-containing protein n=1 Tax=Lupinus albus TaxID=3870 RepID=A0A6A4PIH9_LUPAL|nr:hypothetical protein Lalb_Chr13g0294881 [Lupinus albus]KAF1887990.1 hypothetical protein Lal_00023999 [Lupinus albus]
MATNGGASKRKASNEIDYVNFSIRGQDGSLLYYKLNSDSEFKHVFQDYCQKKRSEYATTQFLYEGQRVLGRQKPKWLNLEDGAEILAMKQVMGGGVAALSFY